MSEMFGEDPDRESRNRAELLAERLLNNVGKSIDSERSIEEEFPIDDVTTNLDRFSRLTQLCLESGVQIPCVVIGEETPIPIDILGGQVGWFGLGAGGNVPFLFHDAMSWQFLERYGRMPRRYMMHDFMQHYMDRLPKSYFGNKVTSMSPEEAVDSVRRLVSSFLAYRIWGIFGRRPTAAPSAAHLIINVESQNPGISVEYSPSYFATWSFFAGPTTPLSPPPKPRVCGPIRPGRYLFGGYGSLMPQRQVEPTVFNIPPTLQVPLTVV